MKLIRTIKDMKYSKLCNHFVWLLLTFALTGCFAIDEDLSDCGEEYKLTYQLRIITNLTTELETVLNEEDDAPVAAALRNHLRDIFTDYAHDVDLSFYTTQKDSTRLHHETHIMNANQSSYTIYLPVREYMHLAVANIADEAHVKLQQDNTCHQASLIQQRMDTIPPHTTGIFSARLPMQVKEGQDQDFLVQLYMVNCATALVLDSALCQYNDVKIYTTGFATDFQICDSLYIYPKESKDSPIVRANDIPISGVNKLCFCSVNYPSPEASSTRTIIETTEPFLAQPSEETLWQYRCYVTLDNGSTTETIISLKLPLRAGQLKILKGFIKNDGEIVLTSDVEAGVSVTLDWKQGNTYEPKI